MTYEISDTPRRSTTFPRFGVGHSTGSLYLQMQAGGKWLSMEKKHSECEPHASIEPVPAGTKITFTQE